MFENYERVTASTGEHVYCEKCERYKVSCFAGADSAELCVEYLTKKLSEFENALESGLLVELTPERVLAIKACAYGTKSNKMLKDVLIYLVYDIDDTRTPRRTRQIHYSRAVEVLSDMVKHWFNVKKVSRR